MDIDCHSTDLEENEMKPWLAVPVTLIMISALACRPQPIPDPGEPVTETGSTHDHQHHESMSEGHGHEEEHSDLRARAPMYDAEGNHLGDLHFEMVGEAMRVHGNLSGLPPSTRGFHVHENGVCDPPDFMSAGGHFNPHGHPHGGPDDAHDARHVGDFGNITVADDGTATIDFTDELATLRKGSNQIVGYSVIIHQQRDDLVSQPTGDAGPRIACGIVEWAEN
jgi:superoxide dismutase, Cu-Zn family